MPDSTFPPQTDFEKLPAAFRSEDKIRIGSYEIPCAVDADGEEPVLIALSRLVNAPGTVPYRTPSADFVNGTVLPKAKHLLERFPKLRGPQDEQELHRLLRKHMSG